MMLHNLKVWTAGNGAPPSVVRPAETYLLTKETLLAADAACRDCLDGVAVLIPQSMNGASIAALLVPDELHGRLTRNGAILAAGIHVLCHGDEIAHDNYRAWTAKNDRFRETYYDPRVHGENVYCARTRNRLVEGEPIVVCPGTPSNSCTAVYSRSAWLNGTCHACGYDAGQPGWTPPHSKKGLINELLELAER
jgi:hypothetical protein